MASRGLQASGVSRGVSEERCTCTGRASLQLQPAIPLPCELSSFVGRGPQLHDIASRLQSDRLVTITGGGGIGKTRLALQVARGIGSEGMPCAWTALSASMQAADVIGALVASVCGHLAPGDIESLAASIGDRQLVLVLDNCEQVIEVCAEVVLRLLQACPGVRVLATSREPLGVPGEVVYPVPPLSVGDAETPTEAVQLFFERARARDPWLPSRQDAQALAVEICAALNGVPLAIELAAACTSSMTLSEVASRLDDALGLLRFGSRAAPLRHRSVRASIDWSHELLDEDERRLLRRLALFEADFTLEAAEAVCAFGGVAAGEIVYLLDRLVSQSLVYASREAETTRFCLWLPVRKYALEQLTLADELAAVRTRLSAWGDGHGQPRPDVTRDTVVSLLDPVGVAEKRSPATSRAAARSRAERPGGLSEREQDVALLIASGRSNREIADELVITKKTAEAHVSHILTKLGLCSRVQIATWSLQQGGTAARQAS
jgi:predicted ATPase/DNA-binding CsgD family transcriptional regulator